jgi:hypothetical protein
MSGLIFLIISWANSIGFSYAPPIDGASFKFGSEKGLRLNFIISFKNGEEIVDSSKYLWNEEKEEWEKIYENKFWRDYYWINSAIRFEYYFEKMGWVQPYAGIGTVGKKEMRWWTECEREDTIFKCVPKKMIKEYIGILGSAGIDIFPVEFLSQILKREISFSKAISFNLEVAGYYLPFKRFKNTDEWDWDREYSGIELGAGIHFNWP